VEVFLQTLANLPIRQLRRAPSELRLWWRYYWRRGSAPSARVAAS